VIGERIKKARLAKRWSQSRLGESIGVSQPSISDMESGNSYPIMENLSKLAVALDVNFDWLATGRGEMNYGNVVAMQQRPHYETRPLPRDHQALLDAYDRLKPYKRAALLEFLRQFTSPH
jgi:transcriptional regulator with XRE-family HTH domain